jgi:hypothetical protein
MASKSDMQPSYFKVAGNGTHANLRGNIIAKQIGATHSRQLT